MILIICLNNIFNNIKINIKHTTFTSHNTYFWINSKKAYMNIKPIFESFYNWVWNCLLRSLLCQQISLWECTTLTSTLRQKLPSCWGESCAFPSTDLCDTTETSCQFQTLKYKPRPIYLHADSHIKCQTIVLCLQVTEWHVMLYV